MVGGSFNERIDFEFFSVTIKNGQTVQEGFVPSHGKVLVGIEIPSGFEGTSITFQNSTDQGTSFKAVHRTGALYSETVTADAYNALDPQKTIGLDFFKVVAGSSQTGDITLRLAFRPAF